MNPQKFESAHFKLAADVVRERLGHQPRIGLILGSGLNALVDMLQGRDEIAYADIPHFPKPTVVGHSGRLVSGILEEKAVLIMQGRAHYYEGYSAAEITFPIRVMQVLGIEVLVVTNAAGGLNHDFKAGDVMVIKDHIYMVGLSGVNPLRGSNLDEFGPRFPDMSMAYDADLRALAYSVAEEAGLPLKEGVYVCVGGPNYETPAEVRFLRAMGADAVGMSTAPEVIVARHGGIRVLGFSGITNMARDEVFQGEQTTHEEVLETGKIIVPRLESLVRGVVRRL